MVEISLDNQKFYSPLSGPRPNEKLTKVASSATRRIGLPNTAMSNHPPILGVHSNSLSPPSTEADRSSGPPISDEAFKDPKLLKSATIDPRDDDLRSSNGDTRSFYQALEPFCNSIPNPLLTTASSPLEDQPKLASQEPTTQATHYSESTNLLHGNSGYFQSLAPKRSGKDANATFAETQPQKPEDIPGNTMNIEYGRGDTRDFELTAFPTQCKASYTWPDQPLNPSPRQVLECQLRRLGIPEPINSPDLQEESAFSRTPPSEDGFTGQKQAETSTPPSQIEDNQPGNSFSSHTLSTLQPQPNGPLFSPQYSVHSLGRPESTAEKAVTLLSTSITQTSGSSTKCNFKRKSLHKDAQGPGTSNSLQQRERSSISPTIVFPSQGQPNSIGDGDISSQKRPRVTKLMSAPPTKPNRVRRGYSNGRKSFCTTTGPDASFEEWHLTGTLRATKINGHTRFQMSFDSNACNGCGKQICQPPSQVSSNCFAGPSFTDEEDRLILNLGRKGLPWEEIYTEFKNTFRGRNRDMPALQARLAHLIPPTNNLPLYLHNDRSGEDRLFHIPGSRPDSEIPIELIDPAFRKDSTNTSLRSGTPASAVPRRDSDVYDVQEVLERWGNYFLLKWQDQTYSWVPAKDISKDLKKEFKIRYEGVYKAGVEKVLGTRSRSGKGKYYLIRWVGCKEEDDTWIPEKKLSPDLWTRETSEKGGKTEGRKAVK